jgi:hypothetical protein
MKPKVQINDYNNFQKYNDLECGIWHQSPGVELTCKRWLGPC